LTSIGLGKTKAEALHDLRAAAHFGIETMADLKLREIEKNSYHKEANLIGRIALE
jgi:hypothetical protein